MSEKLATFLYPQNCSFAVQFIITMNIQEAYNTWSDKYDTVINKTRDVEAIALRSMLNNVSPDSILEFGCGTGKNTAWLMSKTPSLTAVDFSPEMLAKAKEKITAPHVQFVQADIQEPWKFVTNPVAMVTCSLVLEHIADLQPVFANVQSALQPGGFFYMGELHPFKQYTGSKAKFDRADGVFELTCFTHHVSDFAAAAINNGLRIINVQEWFDEDDRATAPRILSMLFQKPLL